MDFRLAQPAGAAWQRREQPGIRRASIYPVGVMPDRKRLVVFETLAGKPDRLGFFDLVSAKTEEIFQHEEVEVDGVLNWGRQRIPAAVVYTTEREHRHVFLPEAKEVYDLLAQALPELDPRGVSYAQNNRRIIVEGRSAREAGMFYLLDRDSGRLATLGAAHPELPSRRMAPARSFRFTARDGLNLTGQIIVPGGLSRPPLVVRLGPTLTGPKAENIFDPIAQFLASRGFAYVRIHMRGTPGFSPALREAGDLKLTTAVIDDLEDGVAWLGEQGLVDANRVALFGEEEGGIVAVHAAARGRAKVLVNFDTPMVLRDWELHQLAPSDRNNAELTAMLGDSAAVHAYLQQLDPLKAAAALRIPSFHFYPRGEAGHEMTESGRLLKSALAKSTAPVVFHPGPLIKPETDQAAAAGAQFDALAAFLREHL